jgi:hypothetical protein
MAKSQADQIEKTEDLNAIGAVSSLVQEKADETDMTQENADVIISDADVTEKTQEVADNADVTGEKAESEALKAFALKDNKINSVSIDKTGKLDAAASSLDGNAGLAFTIVNYTGQSLSKSIGVIIEASSTNGPQSFKMEFPLQVTATAEKAGQVSATLSQNAAMKISGVKANGVALPETKITNDAFTQDDVISTDSTGNISLNLQGYVDRFEAKAAEYTAFEIVGTFNFKIILSGVQVGYEKADKSGIDSTFAAIQGTIEFK